MSSQKFPSFPKGFVGVPEIIFSPPFDFKSKSYLGFDLTSSEGMKGFLEYKQSLREKGYTTEDLVKFGIEEDVYLVTSSNRQVKEPERYTQRSFMKGSGVCKRVGMDPTLMKKD
jgi:hypothetical protein